MDAHEICNSLDIPYENVIYIFLLGSRLWGTSDNNSDYDIIIVTYGSGLGMHHKSTKDYDAFIMSCDEFLKRIDNLEFNETICTLMPNKNILKSHRILRRATLDKEKWKKTIDYRISRDLAYSAKNISKGKIDRASKTRYHLLNTLIIGTQFMKQGHLKEDDFTLAAKYKDTKWTNDVFFPVFKELLEEFKKESIVVKKKRR